MMQKLFSGLEELERGLESRISSSFFVLTEEDERAFQLISEATKGKDNSEIVLKLETAINYLKLAHIRSSQSQNGEPDTLRLGLIAQLFERKGDYGQAYLAYRELASVEPENKEATAFFQDYNFRLTRISEIYKKHTEKNPLTSEAEIKSFVEEVSPYLIGITHLVDPLTGIIIEPYKKDKPNVSRITIGDFTVCRKTLTTEETEDQIAGYEKRGEKAPEVYAIVDSSSPLLREMYVKHEKGETVAEIARHFEQTPSSQMKKRELIINLIQELISYQEVIPDLTTETKTDAERYPELLLQTLSPLLETYGINDLFEKYREGLQYLVMQQIPFGVNGGFYSRETLELLSPFAAYGDFYLDNLVSEELRFVDGGKTRKFTSGFEDLSHILDNPDFELSDIQKETYALLYATLKKAKIISTILKAEGDRLVSENPEEAGKYFEQSRNYENFGIAILTAFRDGKFREVEINGLAAEIAPQAANVLRKDPVQREYFGLMDTLSDYGFFSQLEIEAVSQIRKATAIYRNLRTYAHVLQKEYLFEFCEYERLRLDFMENKATEEQILAKEKTLRDLEKRMTGYLESAQQQVLAGVMEAYNSDFGGSMFWRAPETIELYEKRDEHSLPEFMGQAKKLILSNKGCPSFEIYATGLMTYQLIRSLRENQGEFIRQHQVLNPAQESAYSP